MAEDQSPPAEESARVTPRGVDPDSLGIVDHETLDPDKHYRFVQDRPQRIARMRAKGYRLVSVSEDGVRTVLEDETGADDRIRDGDTVLMCTPAEKFEEGRKKLARVTRGRLVTPEAQFRKKTKGAGPGGVDIPVVTDKEK
jgi:hypothetical protein